MTMPNATLAPLQYGKVKGRFMSVGGDGADPDTLPDTVPLSGTVRFVASASSFLVVAAVPDPAVVLPAPVTVTLDEYGYLALNGVQGVWLLAPTADTNPAVWTWHVEFNLTLASVPVLYAGFNFNLPVYAVPTDAVDLTTASPVLGVSPAGITRGEQGIQGPIGPPVTDEHIIAYVIALG